MLTDSGQWNIRGGCCQLTNFCNSGSANLCWFQRTTQIAVRLPEPHGHSKVHNSSRVRRTKTERSRRSRANTSSRCLRSTMTTTRFQQPRAPSPTHGRSCASDGLKWWSSRVSHCQALTSLRSTTLSTSACSSALGLFMQEMQRCHI